MKRTLVVAVACIVAAAATQVASGPAGAAPPAVVTQAAAWLATQQQPDGGFEVAGFPGFETPDAATSALALAMSVFGPEPALSAPRNIDGTMPPGVTEPEPAIAVRPA